MTAQDNKPTKIAKTTIAPMKSKDKCVTASQLAASTGGAMAAASSNVRRRYRMPAILPIRA